MWVMSYEVNVASRVFAYEASRESLPDEDELQHRQIPWLHPNTPWKVTESKQTKDLPVLSFLIRFRLLHALPKAQLLARHITPIVRRGIATSHFARLFQEIHSTADGKPVELLIVFHGAVSPFQLFHLF